MFRWSAGLNRLSSPAATASIRSNGIRGGRAEIFGVDFTPGCGTKPPGRSKSLEISCRGYGTPGACVVFLQSPRQRRKSSNSWLLQVLYSGVLMQQRPAVDKRSVFKDQRKRPGKLRRRSQIFNKKWNLPSSGGDLG